MTHIENILPTLGRGSMVYCFNLLHNVRHERTAPIRLQRFESSCNQSVFSSIGSTCSSSLFSFANILYFRINDLEEMAQ